MNVADSNIREYVLNNGGALIDDRFRVLLQTTERENEAGEKTIEYKVLDVLEFIPSYRQPSLFSNNQNTTNPEERAENEES